MAVAKAVFIQEHSGQTSALSSVTLTTKMNIAS